MFSIGQLRRDVRFLRWDATVRVELATNTAIERGRERCPGLPDLSERPDATLAFAPSVVVGAVLRIALPVYFAISTRSLAAFGTSLVVGRVAFRLSDALLLRRLDRAQQRLWERSGEARMRMAARVVGIAMRTSSIALRAARRTFMLGAGLALVVLAASVLGVRGTTAIAVADTVAVLANLLAAVFVLVMFAGMACEALAPTLLGPTSDGDHLMSRGDVALLRPLLATGPARIAKDVWDVLRTLRL